ncbi:hypothetical protein R6Q59_019411 [Mikania micrantha]
MDVNSDCTHLDNHYFGSVVEKDAGSSTEGERTVEDTVVVEAEDTHLLLTQIGVRGDFTPVKLVHTTISQLRPDSPSTLLIVFVIAFQNEKLNEIIKELVKEKRRRKIRLNGIIAELEAEKEKHKMEKDAMSNRMSKIEDMLKTMVRR